MKNPPFYALFVAIYPILYIAAANPGQTPFITVAKTVGVGALAGAFVFSILYFFFRSIQRAGLATLFAALVFYVYGPLHTGVDTFLLDRLAQLGSTSWPTRVIPHLHVILSALSILMLGLGVLVVRRVSSSSFPKITEALNVGSLVLLAFVCMQIGVEKLGSKGAERATAQVVPQQGLSTSILGYNPDIYVIVLDGYARNDVLREYYGFDNAEFMSGLNKRGFVTPQATSSNYYWTYLSLASALNFDYLPAILGDQIPAGSRERAPVYDVLRNNAASRFLKDRGYRYVHFQTSWGATLFNPYADEQVRCTSSLFQDGFHRVISEASWLKALQSQVSSDIARCHLLNFERLSKMGSEKGPKFVFAHFIPPHHPYLFDRNGGVKRNANLSDQFEFQKRLWEDRSQYIDQLVFINQKVLESVERILAESPQPPIILIHSDHGPNLHNQLNWDEKFVIRFGNFSALHLPQAPAGLMPEAGSLVNQMRRVFNHYFQAGLPILPDQHFHSFAGSPYAFRDMTRLRGEITQGITQKRLQALSSEMVPEVASE